MIRTIIDITELASWQGGLTGVPRVINEISAHYERAGDAIFVAWNKKKQVYQRVNYTILQNDPESPSEQVDGVVTRRSQLVSQLKTIKNKSVVTQKAAAYPIKIARKYRDRLANSAIDFGKTIVPAPNDILLVMADWHGNDPNFIDALKAYKKSGVRLVQVCYDLLPIVTPQYSGHATVSFTKYVKNIYPICDLLLTISEHTKKDASKWLSDHGLSVPRIEVVRLGDDFSHAVARQPHDNQLNRLVSGNKPFLLCVGTIEARKNHALLYYVYKLAKSREQELPPIVIVGRPGWLSHDIFEIITKDPDTKHEFIFLQNISDGELSWLYEHCLFTIYPSFYEGWGLPVAESVARGIPCVCSDASSIPEIAGNKVSYFQPYSSDNCLEAIAAYLRPNAIKKAQKGLEGYKLTSWHDCYNMFRKHIGELDDKNN